MSVADTLVQFGIYGSYDLGIHNFLKDALTPVEPTLILLQTSPMRAFADAAAMLAKGMDDPGLIDADVNRSANVPLPLVSVTPGAPTKRELQRIVPMKNLFRTDLPGTDPKIRERWVAKPPLPVWLNYTGGALDEDPLDDERPGYRLTVKVRPVHGLGRSRDRRLVLGFGLDAYPSR
jgi:hypothetical protein